MSVPLPKQNSDGSYTTVPSPMMIDGDGANGQTSAPIYAPAGFRPEPLDYLANAGKPGNWYGIITDSHGIPILQDDDDPAPGAYVSATSYMHLGYSRIDPLAYVDANSVPFIVLPGAWRNQVGPIVLGCRAQVYDTQTDMTYDAGVFDFGPSSKLGEASIAMAKLCGVPHSPKDGGTEKHRFVYSFWPGVPALVNGVQYRLIPA